MPQQLVGIGGSRGVTEIGGEQRDSIVDGILRVASDQSAKALQEGKTKQYIEGKARVAQGESLREVKESQGIFDKIFGRATIGGAEAQTVLQAVDSVVRDTEDNMEEYKNMTTEDFIAQRSSWVAENLLTDDPQVNNMITLATGEAISKSTSVHAKAHSLYKQQNMKLAFENTVMGASKTSSTTQNDPNAGESDKAAATANLMLRMSRLPGQHEDAWRESMATVIENELTDGRPEMYELVRDGKVELQFDEATNQILQEGYEKYQASQDFAGFVEQSQKYAMLTDMSGNPDVSQLNLLKGITEYIEEYGLDKETVKGMASILSRSFKTNAKAEKTKAQVNAVATNADIVNKGDRKEALDKYRFAVEANNSQLPASQQNQASDNLHLDMIQKSMFYGTKGSLVDTRLNRSLGGQLINNNTGTLNKAYADAYQELNSYYDSNYGNSQLVALDGLEERTKSNYLGVKTLVANGYELDEAAHVYAQSDMTYAQAQEAVTSAPVNQKIQSYVDDPNLGGFISNLLGIGDEITNLAEMKAGLKQQMLSSFMIAGNSSDGPLEAAIHTYAASGEVVNKKFIKNNGQSFSSRAGVKDPQADWDGVTKYWMQTVGMTDDFFGAGFDPSNVKIDVDTNATRIIPLDDRGLPIAGTKAAGWPIANADIALHYNQEVFYGGITERIEQTVANIEAGVDFGDILGEDTPGLLGDLAKKLGEFGLFKGSKGIEPDVEHVDLGLFPEEGAGAAPSSTFDFIEQQEGFIDTARDIGDGVITGGYGDTRSYKKGEKVDKKKAKAQLKAQIKEAGTAIESMVTIPLSANQKTALTSLVFNVGEAAFKKSKALKALNSNDIPTFLEEAFGEKGWIMKGSKFEKGLRKRRSREAAIFQT